MNKNQIILSKCFKIILGMTITIKGWLKSYHKLQSFNGMDKWMDI